MISDQRFEFVRNTIRATIGLLMSALASKSKSYPRRWPHDRFSKLDEHRLSDRCKRRETADSRFGRPVVDYETHRHQIDACGGIIQGLFVLGLENCSAFR